MFDETLVVCDQGVVDLEDKTTEENGITFLNRSGDITISWSEKNAAKVKELIRKKMAEGYSFFSMKKVVIESVKIKRKVGPKGVDKLDNLVIDDATFDRMVKGLDDKDLAEALSLGDAKLAKRKGGSKKMDTVKRLKDPDEVMESKQAVGVRPIVGG